MYDLYIVADCDIYYAGTAQNSGDIITLHPDALPFNGKLILKQVDPPSPRLDHNR